MATDTSVTLHTEDGIARVCLNRPDALNAFSVELAEDLLQTMIQIQSNDDVRAVVISGQGRAFCAGGDLNYLSGATPKEVQKLIDPLHKAIEIMTQLPVPVVARLHGVVAGAGVSLAWACDLVLAATGTRFNPAYIGIGVSPDAAMSWHLPRRIGLHKSLELLLLNEPFDASEAKQLHLVNQIYPEDQLVGACNTLLTKLAAAPTFALGQTKRLIRNSFQATLKEQLDAERDSFCDCTQTQDFTSGVDAFLNRHKPTFRGR